MRTKCNVSLLRRLKADESGGVMVEAGAYFVIFFLLCALLTDMSAVFLDKGRLERVSLSLATITQQRERFFKDDENLTDAEAQQLYNLAGALFKGSRLAGRTYAVYAEAAYFASGNSAKISKTQSFSAGDIRCSVNKYAINSQTITDLAVWSADELRWLPVYQVTICITGTQSLFRRLGGVIGLSVSDLSVSNAFLPR